MDKSNIADNNIIRNQIIRVRNPLSEDYTIMRPTTFPSMMQTLSTNNAKKNKEVGLFDISRVYKDVDNQISKGNTPVEEMVITLGLYGENVDFYSLKGLVETVLQSASVLRYEVFAEKQNPSYHPGKTAKITVGNDVIAIFGEVHPIVSENYDISNKVYIAEISLDKLVKYAKVDRKYIEVPKYPAVERDIAMVLDEDIEVGQIEKIITKKSKKILEEIKLFDVYRNEKLGLNKKSVAYSLKFRSKDKTLTDDEINSTMNEIVTELEKNLKAELRK